MRCMRCSRINKGRAVANARRSPQSDLDKNCTSIFIPDDLKVLFGGRIWHMNNDRSRRCHLPQKWYYMHFCRRQSADVRTANYRRIVSRPVNMSSESVRLSSSYACHLVFFRRFTTLVVRNSLALPLPPQKSTPFSQILIPYLLVLPQDWLDWLSPLPFVLGMSVIVFNFLLFFSCFGSVRH